MERSIANALDKILGIVHPSLVLSRTTRATAVTLIMHKLREWMDRAGVLVRRGNRQTLSTSDVQDAAVDDMPRALREQALAYGSRALVRMSDVTEELSKRPKEDPNLHVSSTWLKRWIRKQRFAPRVSVRAPVYLAAVLESLCVELLDASGRETMAKQQRHIRIVHLRDAVRNDRDLRRLFATITLAPDGTLYGNMSGMMRRKRQSVKRFQERT